MKNLFKTIFIIFAALTVFSCRNSEIPEDIHEHNEIEKLTVKIINKDNAADEQTINYISGKADRILRLEQGKTYLVQLDFGVKHDDHYHSVNDDIIAEKDEHYITFAVAGAAINVLRTADDIRRTDGKKIGLKTEWSVISAGNGTANIKLVHTPATIEENYPSAENQQGRTTGGEADVNANIGFSN